MTITLSGAEEIEFWAQVRALLDDRAESLAPGPRTPAELESVMGVAAGAIRGRIARARGLSVFGEWPSVEAVLAGLNHLPMTVQTATLGQFVDLSKMVQVVR